jgi:hypothetical protein
MVSDLIPFAPSSRDTINERALVTYRASYPKSAITLVLCRRRSCSCPSLSMRTAATTLASKGLCQRSGQVQVQGGCSPHRYSGGCGRASPVPRCALSTGVQGPGRPSMCPQCDNPKILPSALAAISLCKDRLQGLTKPLKKEKKAPYCTANRTCCRSHVMEKKKTSECY